MHHDVTVFIGLLLVALTVAVILQRIRLPFTVTLVAVGVVIGATDLAHGVHITPELVLTLFLPGLLFEASQHISFASFSRDLKVILTLAVPGVMVGTGLTGVLLYFGLQYIGVETPLALTSCLIFGCMVAATDPISVIALFRSLKVHPRLGLLLEGESLFNDGTAIVFFGILLEIALGGKITFAGGLLKFLVVAGGGTLVGLAAGLLAARFLRTTEDHLVEIGVTVVLAYGVFLFAEHVHVSGVIATVVAGLVNGNLGARQGITAFSRTALYSFWEFAAFVINSMVFLIMGIDIHPIVLLQNAGPILVAAVAMQVARAAGIYILTPIAGRFVTEPIPKAWHHVIYWGGLRGSLSIVLALSLPKDFPQREFIVHMVFGVVALSVCGQGLSMGPLLRRLGLAGRADPLARERAELRARLHAQHAALDRLESLRDEHAISRRAHGALQERHEHEAEGLEARLRELLSTPDAQSAELAEAEHALQKAMRTAIIASYQHQEISAETAGKMLDELAADEEPH